MSAESMIRELFRGLETTLHERLSLIEQVLNTVEKPKIPLYDNEFVKRIERLERLERLEQRNYSPDNNLLEGRVNALQEQLMRRSTSDTSFLEARINALEEQLASTCAELETVKMRLKETTSVNAHSALPSVIGEEEVPEEVPEEEVPEEDAPEEDEGGEAEVLDDVEEGEALEEFQYRGVTYYKDGDNNVYTTDEEGTLNPEPVARWTGTKLVRIVS